MKVDTFYAATPLEAYEEAALTQLSIQVTNAKAMEAGNALPTRLLEVSATNDDGQSVQTLLPDSMRRAADVRMGEVYQKMMRGER